MACSETYIWDVNCTYTVSDSKHTICAISSDLKCIFTNAVFPLNHTLLPLTPWCDSSGVFSQQSHLNVWQKQLFLCKPYWSSIAPWYGLAAGELIILYYGLLESFFNMCKTAKWVPGVLQGWTVFWISGCQTELHASNIAIIDCIWQSELTHKAAYTH